jgi:hypothetical protein
MRAVPTMLAYLILTAPVAANCSDATTQYTSSLSSLGMSLTRYARCLQNSKGLDDCSGEFRRVRGTQTAFELAIAARQTYCRGGTGAAAAQ